MTEEQIKDGYALLATDVEAPLDAVARVEERIRSRRRRRRTWVAGAVVVVAAGGGWGALELGEDPETDAIGVAAPPPTLTLTREDGTTHDFTDLTVTCRPPAGFAGEAANYPGQRIWAHSPMPSPDAERISRPFVFIEGRVDRLPDQRSFDLPLDGPGGTEDLPLLVFVADPEGAPDGNEVSSAEGEARGTVKVVHAACDPAPELVLEVDATLGSEEQKQPLRLEGSVQ